MSEKRYRPEENIVKLRESGVLISQGKKVVNVIQALGITDVTCYRGGRSTVGCRFPRPSL